MREITICLPMILNSESLGVRNMFYGGTAYEDDLENAPIFSSETSGNFSQDSSGISGCD